MNPLIDKYSVPADVTKQLQTDHAVYVGMDTKSVLAPLIQGFEKLLQDPIIHQPYATLNDMSDEHFYGMWTFDHRDTPGDPDLGVVIRNGQDGNDIKTFLHYTPELPQLLSNRGVDYREHVEFLELCSELHKRCRELLIEVCNHLDEALPGYEFSNRFERSTDHVLRILAYTGVRSDSADVPQIGRPHRDRNALTLQLGESCGGYEGSTNRDGPYELFEALAGHVLMFAGLKAEELTNEEIRAFWHRIVIPKGMTRYSDVIIRWAVVFFSHFDGVDITKPTH